MSNESKKIHAPNLSHENMKRTIEKNRATKEEVMEATRKGIDTYRDTLKNLAKR